MGIRIQGGDTLMNNRRRKKMSKSIYEEALEIVDESLYQPDNSVIFKHTGLNELREALEQAQKQEKLLKKLQEKIIKLSSFIESSAILKYEDLLMFYKEIKEQLKELEND